MRYFPGTNKLVYKYTTMCSYALGQSDYYLLTGDSGHLRKVLLVADYIVKSCIDVGDFVLLKEPDCNGEHTGNISAMIQGEAMSVLCRASYFTGEEDYLSMAIKLIPPFEMAIEDGGVTGTISETGLPWYEEYVTAPLNHVLNGMIYSLWGLRDVHLLAGDNQANRLFNEGINYVRTTLPLFDSGYWSYYWVSEKGNNYTASMMYHNLHICQLKALYNQTSVKEFLAYADKFKEYTNRFFYRFKAVKDITKAKFFGIGK